MRSETESNIVELYPELGESIRQLIRAGALPSVGSKNGEPTYDVAAAVVAAKNVRSMGRGRLTAEQFR